jgi:hypothetical protein
MAQQGREKRGFTAMWRERKERKRERIAAMADRVRHQHRIEDTPEVYEQAVRSVHTSGGGLVP